MLLAAPAAVEPWRVGRIAIALALQGTWERGSRPPSRHERHLWSSEKCRYVGDRVAHAVPLAACPVAQVVRTSSGHPDLRPDDTETVLPGPCLNRGRSP